VPGVQQSSHHCDWVVQTGFFGYNVIGIDMCGKDAMAKSVRRSASECFLIGICQYKKTVLKSSICTTVSASPDDTHASVIHIRKVALQNRTLLTLVALAMREAHSVPLLVFLQSTSQLAAAAAVGVERETVRHDDSASKAAQARSARLAALLSPSMMRPTVGCGARPAVRWTKLALHACPHVSVSMENTVCTATSRRHSIHRRRTRHGPDQACFFPPSRNDCSSRAPGFLAACLGPARRNAPPATQRDGSTYWTRKRHSHGPSLAAERSMAAAAGVGYDTAPAGSSIRRVSETFSETIRRLWHSTWERRCTRKAPLRAHDDEGEGEGEAAEARINCRNLLAGRSEIVPVQLGSFQSERIIAGSRLPQIILARIVCSFRGGQCLLYVFRPVVAPCCPPALPTSIDP
jgi:hypothetical protein